MPMASQLTHSEMSWPPRTSQMLTPGIVKDLLDSAWSGRADATREDEDW